MLYDPNHMENLVPGSVTIPARPIIQYNNIYIHIYYIQWRTMPAGKRTAVGSGQRAVNYYYN